MCIIIKYYNHYLFRSYKLMNWHDVVNECITWNLIVYIIDNSWLLHEVRAIMISNCSSYLIFILYCNKIMKKILVFYYTTYNMFTCMYILKIYINTGNLFLYDSCYILILWSFHKYILYFTTVVSFVILIFCFYQTIF